MIKALQQKQNNNKTNNPSAIDCGSIFFDCIIHSIDSPVD